MHALGSNELALIKMTVGNLEEGVEADRASLILELADIRDLIDGLSSSLASRAAPPRDQVEKVRAASLDLERRTIELTSKLQALECARMAHRAIETARIG